MVNIKKISTRLYLLLNAIIYFGMIMLNEFVINIFGLHLHGVGFVFIWSVIYSPRFSFINCFSSVGNGGYLLWIES